MQNEHKFLSRSSSNRGTEATGAGGVATFTVKYTGCIEVLASMKVLDFATRSFVARECIHRVIDATQGKTPTKRNVEKKVQQCIAKNSCLEHAGNDVQLCISSRCLEIISLDTNEVIVRHDMPRISFASGGDLDTLDYIAYVAKDIAEWRACYVIECGNEKAQAVISAMGHAFELRYKEYYGGEMKSNRESLKRKELSLKPDQEYYNDMPAKSPPEPPSLNTKAANKSPSSEKRRERLSSNLIDLDTPIETSHEYVNETNFEDDDKMIPDLTATPHSISQSIEAKLSTEKWFHGRITRTSAESLLSTDGDFLVRESQNTRGQFVLTGMKGGQPKHLLLIDPEGCVRTKDRVFDSIPHLINYHWTNCLPIISAESALLLETPVLRATELKQ